MAWCPSETCCLDVDGVRGDGHRLEDVAIRWRQHAADASELSTTARLHCHYEAAGAAPSAGDSKIRPIRSHKWCRMQVLGYRTPDRGAIRRIRRSSFGALIFGWGTRVTVRPGAPANEPSLGSWQSAGEEASVAVQGCWRPLGQSRCPGRTGTTEGPVNDHQDPDMTHFSSPRGQDACRSSGIPGLAVEIGRPGTASPALLLPSWYESLGVVGFGW
jgi:hypothetical protein